MLNTIPQAANFFTSLLMSTNQTFHSRLNSPEPWVTVAAVAGLAALFTLVSLLYGKYKG